MQRLKPKLVGSKLKRLIFLTIYNSRNPRKTKDILEILRRNHQVSRSTFYLKIQELEEEGEIIKIPNLAPSNCSLYYYK